MATTVAQHQQTEFTDPQNGNSPIDADEVTANDNALRTAYNAHDADTGIHVQSSLFSALPSAGTSGRKYLTVDQGTAPTEVFLWYDDGTNWYEADYLRNSGGALTGDLTITDTTGPQLKVAYDGSNYMTVSVASSGATSISVSGGTRSLTLNAFAGVSIPVALTLAGGLVSYGANDSGGAGFRTVLVPNA